MHYGIVRDVQQKQFYFLFLRFFVSHKHRLEIGIMVFQRKHFYCLQETV